MVVLGMTWGLFLDSRLRENDMNMLTRARTGRDGKGKIMAIIPPSWQSWFKNHGNHSPIMAIMVQQPEASPFHSAKGGNALRHSREGENPQGTGGGGAFKVMD